MTAKPWPDAEHPFFVYDSDQGELNCYSTAAERDAAHAEAIAQYLDEDEWTDGVENVMAGVITHTTVESERNFGYVDYLQTALQPAVPEAEPTRKFMQACTMGMGCDEVGVCYADAHEQPEQRCVPSIYTDEFILEALTIPGLNVEASFEPRELPLLLMGIRDMLKEVAKS